ncbi:hypothetical protein ACWDKQ_21755 [Saccharopolyspora sp. NPDC000995]
MIVLSGCSSVLGRRWAGQTDTVYWQGARGTVVIVDTAARQGALGRSRRYQPSTDHKLPPTS